MTAIQNVNDDYVDNIYFEFKSNTLCYVTGLRENSEYTFELSDTEGNLLASIVQKTETVEVIEEYDYIDGWTNCFAYEKASGLTRDPSYSALFPIRLPIQALCVMSMVITAVPWVRSSATAEIDSSSRWKTAHSLP